MHARNLSSLLAFGIALSSCGCAGFWEGVRREAEYEREHPNPQAHQPVNNQVLTDYSRAISTTPAPTFIPPYIPSAQPGTGIGNTPVQQQQQLPSSLELYQIEKGQGVQTGNTRMSTDGIWHEYRTTGGTTYWSLSH